MDYKEAIKNIREFSDAFELVRRAVSERLGMRRAGLSLLLQDMPGYIGAYHVLGSNYIVINKRVLGLIKGLAKSKEEYNSYLFVVIMHEYLHSLGIVNELMVRRLTYEVCKDLLGDEHIATRMASTDPSSIYPEIRTLDTSFGNEFYIVKDFEDSNITYIS